MPQPTTAIFLNKTTPAPPSGQQNIVFQTDGGTPQQKVTGVVPLATDSLAGAVKPDGITCQVDGTGKLTVNGGVGGASTVHSESLTDGNANFIFDATLTTGGDIITVVGVPN